MFVAIRILLPVVFVAFAGGPVSAGWLTIRNDTKQELIIQDVVVVNGRAKPGRAIKLLPGESVRENRTAAGSKAVMIFDAAAPIAPLLTGKVAWDKGDVTFALKADKMTVTLAVEPPPKKP